MNIRRETVGIVIPIFNDWDTLCLLIERINSVLATFQDNGPSFSILIIDDGSTQGFDFSKFDKFKGSPLTGISIVELGRNLGNQRALAVALGMISQNAAYDSIILMDGDGEDPPEYIPQLINKYMSSKSRTAVFAKRIKRAESLTFRFYYQVYRAVHWLLTGKTISMGNFSIISSQDVRKLTLFSELWSHYPAAFMRSKIPWQTIDIVRGKRIAGRTKMNFTSLLIHGLSGISVNLDVVGIRSIIASLIMIGVAGLAVGLLIYVRLFTNLAVPGWASTLGISLLSIIIQASLGSILLAFFVLNGKNISALLTPAKNFEQFILKVTKVF